MADNNLPPPCANNCGFFGSLETNNLCSKCFKDFLKEFEAKLNVSTSPKTPVSVDSSSSPSSSDSAPLKPKNGCDCCNKKVGLIGFSCRCGKVFCRIHRFPDQHSCDFDFKAADRRILAKNNTVVKADKLESRI